MGAVGPPRGVGGVGHGVVVAVGDALVVEVGVDDVGVSVAQREGCGLLPCVGEPVHADRFWGVGPVLGDHRERAAGVHGLQLCVVADQQHFCASGVGEVGDAVQREGAGEGGFVDDDELPWLEGGAVEKVVVLSFRGVFGDDPEIVAQYPPI